MCYVNTNKIVNQRSQALSKIFTMKSIITTFKRTGHVWFSIGTLFLTSLIFTIFPSCQKDKDIILNQESFNGTDIFFTPEFPSSSTVFLEYQFVRKTGAPFIETRTLENADLYSNLVLNIQNGDSKKTRVASAEIWIDGILIFGPSDFSKNVTSFTKQINVLSYGSILEVKLNSTPGSFLNIWIEGTLKESTPIVTTDAVLQDQIIIDLYNNISATCHGNITNNGGSSVTERGVCWSISENPTVDLITKTIDGSGTGAFTSSLTGLEGNTTYHVRAYATNSKGTGYGNAESFTTPQKRR